MVEIITGIIAWAQSPQAALVFFALWTVSEVLASIPAIEANSIFQLVKKGIAWLVAKFPKKV